LFSWSPFLAEPQQAAGNAPAPCHPSPDAPRPFRAREERRKLTLAIEQASYNHR